MKKIITIFILFLSSPCLAKSLSYSYLITTHFFTADYNDYYTHDNRTTVNPSFNLDINNSRFMLLQDSIGDLNMGYIYKFPIHTFKKINFRLIGGGYLINYKEWEKRKFEKSWINIPNTDKGLIILFGPAIEINLIKYGNMTLNTESFMAIGGFLSNGLNLKWEF